jgi:hypothetical protein
MLLGNHLLIVKILPVILFRVLVLAFRKPPVILKIVPKVAAMNVHRRNSTNESEGKPEHAAYVTIFRIVSVFKEASRKFTFIFLFNFPG